MEPFWPALITFDYYDVSNGENGIGKGWERERECDRVSTTHP